jgi:hypothetical protein
MTRPATSATSCCRASPRRLPRWRQADPLPDGGTRIVWESRFGTHGVTGWLWVQVVRWVLKRWSADLATGASRAAQHPESPRAS